MTSTLYFHVTPRSRLASIRRVGVVPGRRRQWSTQFGAKQGEIGKIYMFDAFAMAVKWAARMEWDTGKPIVILVIMDPGPLEPDDHVEAQIDRAIGGWYKTRHPISPANIVRVIPLTLDLKRQYVAAQQNEYPPKMELPEG